MEYTIKDICRKLQVSDKTVRRYIDTLRLDNPTLYNEIVHKTNDNKSMYKLSEGFYKSIKQRTKPRLPKVLPMTRKSQNEALGSEAKASNETVEALKQVIETLEQQLQVKDEQLERKDQLLAQQVLNTQKLQDKLFMIEDKKMNIFQRLFRKRTKTENDI